MVASVPWKLVPHRSWVLMPAPEEKARSEQLPMAPASRLSTRRSHRLEFRGRVIQKIMCPCQHQNYIQHQHVRTTTVEGETEVIRSFPSPVSRSHVTRSLRATSTLRTVYIIIILSVPISSLRSPGSPLSDLRPSIIRSKRVRGDSM